MTDKIKNGIFCFIFFILLLPLLQQKLQFVESGRLKGGYKDAVDAEFSIHSWIDGSYQHQWEQCLNDQAGFRPDLVRLNNQIDYSLFDKCHAGWTLKGKDRYLFQSPYINAYYGWDYDGYPAILEKAIKLKAIQDTLSRLGKSLILVYLPSKASSYPEYFPDNRVRQPTGMTNYNSYRHACDSLGINQVDMDAWFVAMKNKSREPIFSKQGIHWTQYGAMLGGDSLMKYVERLRNIRLQHPVWSEIEHTDDLRAGDDDIAQELNLIFPVAKETLAYPVQQDIPDSERKINAIYIGDSYAFKMILYSSISKMNKQCEYWGYFNEVHDVTGNTFNYIQDYDWHGAINKTNCVILAYTLFNFWHLGNGFIEKAYDYYYPAGTKLAKS